MTGKNRLVFKDVLVGDVWGVFRPVEYGVWHQILHDAGRVGQGRGATDSHVHGAEVGSPAPGADIAPAPAKCPTIGTWQVCNPRNLASNGEWTGFPAVGFYFGRQIHNFTKQPVGLIGTTWGGTRINSWMSVESLQAQPAFKSYAAGAVDFRDNYERIKSDYEAKRAAWQEEMAKWSAENKDAIAEAKTAMDAWNRAKKEADAAHQPAPPEAEGDQAPAGTTGHGQQQPDLIGSLQWHGGSPDSLWNQRGDLVSGRVQRGSTCLLQARLAGDDRRLAQAVESRGLPVSCCPVAQLYGSKAGSIRKHLGGSARGAGGGFLTSQCGLRGDHRPRRRRQYSSSRQV